MEAILLPLIGGIVIGLASSILLFGLGRITGISGIFSNAFIDLDKGYWRHLFVIGLLIGGLAMKIIEPSYFEYSFSSSIAVTIIGGLLVGFGTRLGSGCTSGHGVCGIPRRSMRSITATLVFILFGVITVYIKGLL